MGLKELQRELDIQKWALSEKECKDMCGCMPYCPECDKSSAYPCAEAYNKAVDKAAAAKAGKKPAEKAAPKAKAAKNK